MAKKIVQGLAGKPVNHLLRAGAVGGSGSIPQIYIVILRESGDDFFEYFQSAKAGVKNTNGR